MNQLNLHDVQIAELIAAEHTRQNEHLELIASENFVSAAVLEATGSILTNKYAEGYPHHRYYGGCEYVDQIEDVARERGKQLFGCDYINVQPHSGSQANMGVFFAVLQPGDTILGMDLNAGGHLTHGATVNFSGKIYHSIAYGVEKESELIDFAQVEQLAHQHRPKMIIAGASAYPRVIDFARFRAIADAVGAYLLVDMAHIAGLVATGAHPSPMPYADFVTATSHKTLRGPRGGLIFIGKDKENNLGITMAKSGRMKRFGELIDSAIFPGGQGGPLMHVIAGKAVAFGEALRSEFAVYQEQVIKNSRMLAKTLSDGGLRVVTGGTDNHMCLIDLRGIGMSGKEAEERLQSVNITCNKNAVPFDTVSPLITSGIRLGTPALTSRGLKEAQMQEVGELIIETLTCQESVKFTAILQKVLVLSGQSMVV
jgi:glycine hydroxymethyltransferase